MAKNPLEMMPVFPVQASRETERKQEEEIINGIMENCAEWKDLMNRPNEELLHEMVHQISATFRYGSKDLTLFFTTNEKATKVVATTLVENTSPENKKENETTLLYKTIKEAIQEMADKLEKPIIYEISTTNKNMKNWANSLAYGKGIFDWDEAGYDNFFETYNFEKTFNHRKQEGKDR